MCSGERVELRKKHSLRGFYKTPGVVKVFVFAFVFSLLAFLFLLLRLFLVRVLKIHLGLLYALAVSRFGLGA
jgi:hypothetical protein